MLLYSIHPPLGNHGYQDTFSAACRNVDIDHFDGALSANETDYLRRIRAFPGIEQLTGVTSVAGQHGVILYC